MTRTYIINTRQFEEETVFQKALETVSPYRRQKIALLKHWKDKNRSMGASVALNEALRAYGLEERVMEYDLGKQGKPSFRRYPELHFSLSHSGDYAVCSIGRQEIGNDIEWVRDGKERVAERFFAQEELIWIQKAAASEERADRMFRIWTMKESFLKVTGLGMSYSLKDFAMIIGDDGVVHLKHLLNDKVYFMKEYAMPDIFKEPVKYKISVCSENPDFAPDLEPVFAAI